MAVHGISEKRVRDVQREWRPLPPLSFMYVCAHGVGMAVFACACFVRGTRPMPQSLRLHVDDGRLQV